MIDIENKVYTTVKAAVETEFPNINCSGDYVETFATFPAMTINEIGNLPYWASMDDSLYEHHAIINYEINVYANETTSRKQTCKRILALADEAMQSMKFIRTTGPRRLPNVDRSIYRMYVRYTAVVAEGETIGDDIVYRMYRRRGSY